MSHFHHLFPSAFHSLLIDVVEVSNLDARIAAAITTPLCLFMPRVQHGGAEVSTATSPRKAPTLIVYSDRPDVTTIHVVFLHY